MTQVKGTTIGESRGNSETLHRAENGNGRCDHAVTIKEGSADHRQQGHSSDCAGAIRRRAKALRDDSHNAKIPPSPWLSARITKVRYLTVTTMISDQNIRKRIPNRSSTPALPHPQHSDTL
jgi:hypothetical protein